MESSDGSRFAARTRSSDENESQKRTKCSDGVVNLVDRISSLPDSVLCWILSFLPTSEAVATSILSKRWKFLWTEVPSFHFEDRERFSNEPYKRSESVTRFVKFVNKVMLLSNVQSLDKFYLCCYCRCDAFYVDTWVRTAIARNVRILDVSVISFSNAWIELPNSIFTCTTLEFLKLYGGFVVKGPSFVCLPRLVSLTLSRVDYESYESISVILSGCAVLEFLFIEKHDWDRVGVIKIASPSLKTLKLDFYFDYGEGLPCKLEINAPALEYLCLTDGVTESFSIESLKALCEAEVDIYSDFLDESDRCDSAVKRFLALQHVKILTLSVNTMEVLNRTTAHFLPKFDSLTKLVVEALCCGWNRLPALLESAVSLEVLDFSLLIVWGNKCDRHHETCWRSPDQVPRCLLTSLKEIFIRELTAREDALAMISYFLKDGRVLERVELHSRSLVHGDDFKGKFQLLQKIAMFPRKSPTCEVAFY